MRLLSMISFGAPEHTSWNLIIAWPKGMETVRHHAT
jgi:hypothetical protein